ncbi:MAG: MATE family efflux transporter [Lachnospiraceae bacterium]|nr:MATE family efflux transporter [Lachnospiraceae bacterium]
MNRKMDMVHGSIWKKLLLFALPLAASSMLQQLFNSADLLVVGQFADSNALAAVGANGAIIHLLINLFVGLTGGTNVLVSTFIGQQNKEGIKKAIHTSISIAVISGIFLGVLGQFIAKPVLTLMSTPAEILDLTAIYFRIYFAGMPFFMLYNFVSAIYRSKGDTRTPLLILAIAGVINVGLNLFFVIVCHLSVEGVAIATVVSNAISAFVLLGLMTKDKSELGFHFKDLCINGPILKRMFAIGIPGGLQGSAFSISNVIIQTAMNSLGPAAIAANTVAQTYENFCFFFCGAFGQASLSFVGQNYGAGNFARCRETTRKALILGMASAILLASIFAIFGHFFCRLYTPDEEVIKLAMYRLRIATLFCFLNGTDQVFSGALRVYGHTVLPAVISIVTICGTRLLMIFTIFRAYPSYPLLVAMYPISWILSNAAILVAYLIILSKMKKKMYEGGTA